METLKASKWFQGALSAAGLVAVVCAIHLSAGAVEPMTQPAGSPTTMRTMPPAPDNISVAAIELDDRQLAALSAVRDGQHWNEPAFHIMLARVWEFVDPESAVKEYPTLESPAIGNLTDFPTRYRAQKIRVTMWVHTSRMFVSGSKDWDARPDWPRGRKLWRMDGFLYSPGGKKKEVLVVYSLVDPTKLLGSPGRIDSGTGEHIYVDGKGIELAAVYYKTFKQMSKGSDQIEPHVRNYPLVIAYYLKASQGTAPVSTESSAIRNLVVVVGVFLLGLLYMVRRQVKRVRSAPIGSGGAGSVKYVPRRNVEDDDLPDEERDDEPVNQDLVDAVRAFEKKSKEKDGTDDKS